MRSTSAEGSPQGLSGGDDRWFVCFRFLFLLVLRMCSWLRLSRREESWKSTEILLLRHQLRVLRRQRPSGPKPTWADRPWFAVLLFVVSHPGRAGLKLFVAPQTALRWHRDIARRNWARKVHAHTARQASHRPQHSGLAPRLAKENPAWGYRRIHGEVLGLGIRVAPSTLWEMLNAAGITPVPRHAAHTWGQFLRGQADAILATYFSTVDLLNGTTAYVLTVIEHASRRIRILGVTAHRTMPG